MIWGVTGKHGVLSLTNIQQLSADPDLQFGYWRRVQSGVDEPWREEDLRGGGHPELGGAARPRALVSRPQRT